MDRLEAVVPPGIGVGPQKSIVREGFVARGLCKEIEGTIAEREAVVLELALHRSGLTLSIRSQSSWPAEGGPPGLPLVASNVSLMAYWRSTGVRKTYRLLIGKAIRKVGVKRGEGVGIYRVRDGLNSGRGRQLYGLLLGNEVGDVRVRSPIPVRDTEAKGGVGVLLFQSGVGILVCDLEGFLCEGLLI